MLSIILRLEVFHSFVELSMILLILFYGLGEGKGGEGSGGSSGGC